MDLLKEFPEVTGVREDMYRVVVHQNANLHRSDPETIALAFALSQRRSLQRRQPKRNRRWFRS